MALHLRKARVKFDRPVFPLDTLAQTLADGFRKPDLRPLKPGAHVAIAVGSRGIANTQRITREVVLALQGLGLKPFIIPAMGSHGGATDEGQREILASFNITPETMGCPIRSSMNVVPVDNAGLGHELYMDAHAAAADGVVLINRVKPHTDFHGTHESGLCKMSVIGLGKQKQAEIMHGFGVPGLRDMTPRAAKHVLSQGKIWAGVAVVENAYDETAVLEVIAADKIYEREPVLLDIARRHMPRIIPDTLDVLIVCQMGKNFSGLGMDTGIIGRMYVPGEPEPDRPKIRAIATLDISEESHGNAIGVGLADVITKRLFHRIDHDATTMNVATAGLVLRGKIPLSMPTDAAAYGLALRTTFIQKPETARVMCIRNTLHLDEILASPALEKELSGRPDIEWVGPSEPAFDASGKLRDW